MQFVKQFLTSITTIAVCAAPGASISLSSGRELVPVFENSIPTGWNPASFERLKDLNPNVASRASWYGPGFYGERTANGEIYTGRDLTAAHRTLPFGTRVRVTNLINGKSVVVRINDDGPHRPDRIIDLSETAARRIGMISLGVVPVRLEVLR